LNPAGYAAKRRQKENFMQGKPTTKLSLLTIPVLIIGAVLAVASLARVDRALADSPRVGSERGGDRDDDTNTKPCTDRTLRGDYGFSLTGEILGPGIQLRGVVLQHYDGRGKFTQVDHVVDDGRAPMQEWTPGTGTYTVNPDCTGSAIITVPNNPLSPLSIHFVVVKQGREIRQVVDSNAVIAIGNKVD
jgi:hypothetical protein